MQSCYICLQDPGFASNGNITAPPITEGMCGGEVERRLNQAVSKIRKEKYIQNMGFSHL